VKFLKNENILSLKLFKYFLIILIKKYFKIDKVAFLIYFKSIMGLLATLNYLLAPSPQS
jgi:hypothetical protein